MVSQSMYSSVHEAYFSPEVNGKISVSEANLCSESDLTSSSSSSAYRDEAADYEPSRAKDQPSEGNETSKPHVVEDDLPTEVEDSASASSEVIPKSSEVTPNPRDSPVCMCYWPDRSVFV